MFNEQESQLIEIIKNEAWLMEILQAVQNLNLPDWFVAAGAIRNTVWDVLHEYKKRTPLNDLDIAYCDLTNLSSEKDKVLEKELEKTFSGYCTNFFNQARAHLKKGSNTRIPATISEEGIRYWIETPTCVGIRLERDLSFTICQPYGISDLMNLVVRPIPQPFQDLKLYQKRMQEKQWQKTWPKLKIYS